MLRARSVRPCARAGRMDRHGPSPPSASTRPRRRRAIATPPACWPTSAGGRIPNIAAQQSLNIIAHASFIGVDHPGRAFLALANLFRHDGRVQRQLSRRNCKALATPRYLERARILAAMMRVVYLLSAAMPGVMPKLRWEDRDGGVLALVIPASVRPSSTASVRPGALRNSPRSPAAGWCWPSRTARAPR